MTQGEKKRQTGYFDLKLTRYCGNCVHCRRNGTHLRCSRHGFAVTSLGICRAGWSGHDLPLNAEEHSLLVKVAENDKT